MNTKHTYDCKRVFKHYDMTCPRCVELSNGAKARDGWQKKYYENKKRNDAIELNAIKNHNCHESNCGPVCTFGDW